MLLDSRHHNKDQSRYQNLIKHQNPNQKEKYLAKVPSREIIHHKDHQALLNIAWKVEYSQNILQVEVEAEVRVEAIERSSQIINLKQYNHL